MPRKHVLAISLALAACVVTGASAALKTVHLGAAAAKPPRVADSVIAVRSAKLDRFAAALARARRSRPPALPPVPHYAPVPMPAPPAPSQLVSSPAPPGAPAPAAAPAAGAAAPQPKVTYVRPAPVVETVQAPTPAQPAWSGDDGEAESDGGSSGSDDGSDG